MNKDTVADKDDTLTAVWEKNHTHAVSKTISAVPATCAKAGNNTYYQCSCGKYFSDSACTKETTVAAQTIAKTTNHSWDKGVITTPATEKVDGVKTYTCTVCGTTKTEAVPYEAEPAVPFKLGDVDDDGKISAADARLTLRASVGLKGDKDSHDIVIDCSDTTGRAFMAADVDFDEKISAADARLILRASVGLEKPETWVK